MTSTNGVAEVVVVDVRYSESFANDWVKKEAWDWPQEREDNYMYKEWGWNFKHLKGLPTITHNKLEWLLLI